MKNKIITLLFCLANMPLFCINPIQSQQQEGQRHICSLYKQLLKQQTGRLQDLEKQIDSSGTALRFLNKIRFRSKINKLNAQIAQTKVDMELKGCSPYDEI